MPSSRRAARGVPACRPPGAWCARTPPRPAVGPARPSSWRCRLSRAERLRPGAIVTLAGIGSAGDYGDGGPATEALLNRPYNLTVGPRGDVYFGDYNNHRVRRVDAQ